MTEPDTVELDRTDWVRVLNTAQKGLDDIPDEDERTRADDLLDEIVDQADICIVDMMDLEAELRQRSRREGAR